MSSTGCLAAASHRRGHLADARRLHVVPWCHARSHSPASLSSKTQWADRPMLRRSVHVTAGTSVRWRVGPAPLTLRPTACALRREGTHRRTRQSSGRIEGAARAQPSRHATPSAAPGAMRPPESHCPSPRLHTDSCQIHPLHSLSPISHPPSRQRRSHLVVSPSACVAQGDHYIR